jgi:hypothetical protein
VAGAGLARPGSNCSAKPRGAVDHGDNIVVEIVWRSAPSRETPRVDTIVLPCPTLVGATDVALPATGGGTEVDMVFLRAGATVDWTPNVPRWNVPRFAPGLFRAARQRFRTARDDTGIIGLALPLRLSQRLVSRRRSCPSKQ